MGCEDPLTKTLPQKSRNWLERRYTLLVFLGILLALGYIHGGLVLKDPILDRDDRHILKYLHGASEYAYYLKSGQLQNFLVYQPLRDLSLFADLEWKRLSGIGTFHLTNLLVWIGIVFLWYRTLSLLHRNRKRVAGIVAVFSVHPVFVNSVGWISARKHLLSCFFVMIATYCLIRSAACAANPPASSDNRGPTGGFRWGAFTAYLLSILSHPISVLWPVWAYWQSSASGSKKLRRRLLAVIAAAGLLVIAINVRYYATMYPVHTGAAKFAGRWTDTVGFAVLAHGHYWLNLVLPIRLAPEYSAGSVLNFIGLLLLIGFCWFTIRRLSARTALPWLIYYLIPLAPVTLWMTNIFVSDTYLLISAFGLMNLILLLISSFESSPSLGMGPVSFTATARIVLLGTFLIFLGLASRQAASWVSDKELWARAFTTEPTPRNTELYANYLLEEGNAEEALPLVMLLRKWTPAVRSLPMLYGKAVFGHPRMDLAQKIRLLEAEPRDNIWTSYFLARLQASVNKFSAAYDLMKKTVSRPTAPTELETGFSLALAETVYYCQKAGQSDCEAMIGKVRRSILPSQYDDVLYTGRMEQLLRSARSKPVTAQ